MYTLQEFIRFTKAWEYIIAIVVILVFVAFWKLISTTSAKNDRKRKDTLAR